MTEDEVLRQRVVDAAAELFAENGYHGTKVQMVARRAGVSPHTVRRLTGGRAELFRAIMSTRVSSSAAARVAAAAVDPAAEAPLAVILAAAQDVYVNPSRSWDVLELEALTRSHTDPELMGIESDRMRDRRENVLAVVGQARHGGGLDRDLDQAAIGHFLMAMSVGLAMLDPVLVDKPGVPAWNAVMARVGEALAPGDLPITAAQRAGTPWRVRVDIVDRPGGLARLTRGLGLLHAYLVGVQVVGSADEYRTIDVFLNAPQTVTRDHIVATVSAVGRRVYVRPGAYDDDVDIPSRVLDGATTLVRNPGWAPVGARILAGADRVEVVPATEGPDAAPNVLRLQWTSTRHVVLHRSWAPFARAERTRASALLRLSAEIAASRGDEGALGWLEPIKEGTVLIRLAQPGDADAVADLHQRCSERTRYLRYVSAGEWRDVQLRRLSGGHRGATLVALNRRGEVVALGNVFPEQDDPTGRAAEMAIIVEDRYQRRGLGRAMVRRQVELAREMGFTAIVAVVLAENTGMLRLLRETELEWTSSIEDAMTTWRAPLPPTPAP